jgi:dUTP pyrophosphatase
MPHHRGVLTRVAITIAVLPLRAGLALPAYATEGAAGLDLAAALDAPLVIGPGAFATVACGFAIAIPDGFEGQIRPRSGLAARHGLTVLNSPGTIDSDYRGEVKVILINHGPAPVTIEDGMRIAQLIVSPVSRVEWALTRELPPTTRGRGGFGHTGT